MKEPTQKTDPLVAFTVIRNSGRKIIYSHMRELITRKSLIAVPIVKRNSHTQALSRFMRRKSIQVRKYSVALNVTRNSLRLEVWQPTKGPIETNPTKIARMNLN